MSSAPISLVVVDGRVSDEKLAELLDLQAEQPQLDYKRVIDLSSTRSLVELAKDVGAMQLLGGYIIGGVDDRGVPTGEMNDGCDVRLFDESRLTPRLLRYLPEPLTVRTRVAMREGNTMVMVCVLPHPNGYAVFHTDGQYERANGKPVIAFRAGEIWWRDGTRSVRMSQVGFEEIILRRLGLAKSEWMDEQQELRRSERDEIAAGYAGRDLARAPLGSLTLGLPTDELKTAVLELLRTDDRVALLHLLKDVVPRAASAIDRDEIDSELGPLLDRLAALATLALEYEQSELFTRITRVFAEIYAWPLGPHDDQRFGFSTRIDPAERGPRVFLAVIERVYGIGALAVRLRRWGAVREIAVQRPERVDDYWPNWLRHALTMASRAGHLRENQGEREVEISLLTRAAQVVENEPELRPDTADNETILTSLVQFDLLANLAAIDDADTTDGKAFYTNWARFREDRVLPIASRLLVDAELRRAIVRERSDAELAAAFLAVGEMAHKEGVRYNGFWGWDRTPVGQFIAQNVPPSS